MVRPRGELYKPQGALFEILASSSVYQYAGVALDDPPKLNRPILYVPAHALIDVIVGRNLSFWSLYAGEVLGGWQL